MNDPFGQFRDTSYLTSTLLYGRKGMDPPVSILTSEADQSPNVTERTVATLWSEVLEVNAPPSSTDDFFALGGDSMAMVMLEFRIKEEFSVELPPGSVLGAPTLRELSDLIDRARAACGKHCDGP